MACPTHMPHQGLVGHRLHLVEQMKDRVEQIRSAFEDLRDSGEAEGSLRNFPNQCCNIACDVLGFFFYDWGADNVSQRCGRITTDQNHCWLVVDGMIVDITADQFGQPKIIVSRESPWHDRLEIKRDTRITKRACEERINSDRESAAVELYRKFK